MSHTTWLPSDSARAQLNDEERELFDWIYEATRDHAVATLLWGAALQHAADAPGSSLWDVVKRMKSQFKLGGKSR